MSSRTFRLAVLSLFSAAMTTGADVRPHGLFTDGAVLQEGQPIPVWGTAGEGETVTVECAGQTLSTVASNGTWRVVLSPLAVGGPLELTMRGRNTVTITNVLVGEVWVASGQSNMWWPLQLTTNGGEVVARATDEGLRLFTVPQKTSEKPCRDVAGQWLPCTPAAVSNFSAVAYYFGRHLRAARGVPVGVIHSSSPGTRAEGWTPPAALALDAEVRAMVATNVADEDRRGIYQQPEQKLSYLYNAMIAPLQSFPIRGVIWYQGESNQNRAAQYARLLSAMIRGWRQTWGCVEFPFLFVQVAPWNGMLPILREAQLEAWQRTPNTAMVVITDVGDAVDVHPPRKEPVGARLALAARALAYGESVEYSGPVAERALVETGRVAVVFSHIGGGLVARDGALRGFEVAGADTNFVPATASIVGDRVVVASSAVPVPVAVRYGWASVPDINLFNRAGLPATPFRLALPADPLTRAGLRVVSDRGTPPR